MNKLVNESGVTLSILVLTIVVMAILITTIGISVTGYADVKTLKTFSAVYNYNSKSNISQDFFAEQMNKEELRTIRSKLKAGELCSPRNLQVYISCQFSVITIQLSTPAKASHRMYGMSKYPAAGLIFLNSTAVIMTRTAKSKSHMNENVNACSLKKKTGQRKFTAS